MSPIWFASAASLALTAGAAHAQDATSASPAEPAATANTAPAAAPEDATGEIIVTAERRETSLQKVPAAIQVVSGADLTKVGIVDTENLQVRIPGLVTSRLGGPTQRPYLRGIGNDLYGIASGNSVATYVDGVYVPNSTQSFQSFNDLDRLEVLKGPQAVLYGRNATGGTILITSKRPSFEFGASGDVSYGNFDDFQARAAITGPIAGDTVAGRLSVQYLDRKGFGKNLPSLTDQDPFRNFAIRGSVLINVSDNLTALIAADYSKIVSGDYVKTPNTNAWNYQATSGQYVADPWLRFGNHDSYAPIKDRGVRLTLNWATPLGDVTSVTSYRNFKYGPFTYDNDDVGQLLVLPTTPPITLGELWVNGSIQTSKQFSHETFLATPQTNPFKLIVGASVFLESASDLQRSIFFAPRYSDRYLKNPAYAAYADAKYDITDNFTISAGARYSYERKTYSLTPLTVTPATLAITGRGATVTGRGSWNSFTPRFGLEWRATDDAMAYFTVTKGFKSGGFNTDNPLNEFAPESIWNYEGGVKARWGGIFTTNVSAFYYDYSDLQVQQVLLPAGTSVVTNAASAKIYGIDGEFSVRPSRYFALGTNIGVMHSEYGNLTLFNDLLTVPTNVSVKGNVLKRAPKISALTYADVTLPIGSNELTLHGEAAYRSRTYYTPFQDAPHSQPSFWLFNANVRFTFDNKKQYISFYGQNLTNKLYASSIEDVARYLVVIDGAPLYTHYGPPRTYGIRYGFNF